MVFLSSVCIHVFLWTRNGAEFLSREPNIWGKWALALVNWAESLDVAASGGCQCNLPLSYVVKASNVSMKETMMCLSLFTRLDCRISSRTVQMHVHLQEKKK